MSPAPSRITRKGPATVHEAARDRDLGAEFGERFLVLIAEVPLEHRRIMLGAVVACVRRKSLGNP